MEFEAAGPRSLACLAGKESSPRGAEDGDPDESGKLVVHCGPTGHRVVFLTALSVSRDREIRSGFGRALGHDARAWYAAYAFAASFVAIALLYNPFVPTFLFAGSWQHLFVLASVFPFLTSLVWMNAISRAISPRNSQTALV